LNFLEALSQTALIRWVGESDWGYPIVLTSHAIGMALVVGILLMFDLRALGVGSRIPFAAFRTYFPVAWVGLVINVCSGTLLFLINYTAFLHNAAFITKISLLIAAALGTWALARDIAKECGGGISRNTKVLAYACIALWIGAIIAGRIIGYISVPE